MAQISDHAYAVILAGGGGTRLWPKSRQKKPKHLLTLFGGQSMLQMTYDRILDLIPKQRVLVITHQDHLKEAQSQLPELALENWIIEPEAKNTALAMGVAAAFVHHLDSEAVLINLAADQIVLEQDLFEEAVKLGLSAAETNNLISIGIEPTFAHTGLGYIKLGSEIEPDLYHSAGFKEKPDLETAEQFLESGKYLWNANLYCWSTKAIFQAFEDHAPEFYQSIEAVLELLKNGQTDLSEIYSSTESQQIDIAVSEKADNLLVVRGKFGWSDIGDWKSLYDSSPKDQDGNVLNLNSEQIEEGKDNIILLNSKNTLVESGKRLVVAIGVEDLAIVDTDDVILICKKSDAQTVKKVIEQLKSQGKTEYL